MKRQLFFIVILVATAYCAAAQTATTSFNVNGIKVIFKPTTKKVIDIRIYFRGGVTNYKPEQAGIERFTLSGAAQCGTKKYAASALRDTAQKYGVQLSGSADYDYGYMEMNCISMYFDIGWDLFAEAVTNPVFDDDEVTLLKARLVTAAQRAESDPDAKLFSLQMRAAFENTPYAMKPNGTEQTLNSFTVADLKNYYKTLLNKNKLFIVAVGNIDKQQLYEKILYAFDNIPASSYVPDNLQSPVWGDNKLVSEQRNLKINYVSAATPAPAFTSVDYVPFRLAVSGMGGNLYSALRTNYHIAYDVWSSSIPLKIPLSMFGANTNNPREAMKQMMDVIKSVQNRGFNEDWLQHLKNIYVVRNYFSEQSSKEVAESLGQAEILGNWQYADDLPQLVNMVTVEQMNRVVNFYITGLHWAYLGNLDAIEGFKPPPY